MSIRINVKQSVCSIVAIGFLVGCTSTTPPPLPPANPADPQVRVPAKPPTNFLAQDDTTVAIAERPGNKRADGYLNILANPHIGIISLIPGRNETLRINGRARLLRDAPFFDELAVRGRRPILALLVDVEQIFFHCPKSFLRSKLWDPDSWRPDALPSHATLTKRVMETPETLEELEEHYALANYSRLLY